MKLWVKSGDYARTDYEDGFVPAATADWVVALREEGVLAETSWCEFHRSQRGQGLKNECWRAQKARDAGYDDHEDCHMVPVLVVRIEGET